MGSKIESIQDWDYSKQCGGPKQYGSKARGCPTEWMGFAFWLIWLGWFDPESILFGGRRWSYSLDRPAGAQPEAQAGAAVQTALLLPGTSGSPSLRGCVCSSLGARCFHSQVRRGKIREGDAKGFMRSLEEPLQSGGECSSNCGTGETAFPLLSQSKNPSVGACDPYESETLGLSCCWMNVSN